MAETAHNITHRDEYTIHEAPEVGTFYYGEASRRPGTAVQWIDTAGRREHVKLYAGTPADAAAMVDQVCAAWLECRR